MDYKKLLNEVDEEIKDLEYQITMQTLALDEIHETLKDFSIKMIDYKIAERKIETAELNRGKLIIRLNEALKIKHIIEKYKD